MTSTLIRDSEALRPLPPEPTDRDRGVPPVPAEEEDARQPARHRPARARAAGQADRAGRVRQRRASSTAYATEEILRTLIPVVGFLAFTATWCRSRSPWSRVLVILMFSYRQTIKAYPSAGGAYIVTKDNLGLLPAQVAGVALLTDYILTVAVSVSAGVAALYSAFPATCARTGSRSRSASSPSSPGATCAA